MMSEMSKKTLRVVFMSVGVTDSPVHRGEEEADGPPTHPEELGSE